MTHTVAELERALAVVAYIVVRHGEAYVPLMDRLEREVEAARAKPDQRDRANDILRRLMHQQPEARNAPVA